MKEIERKFLVRPEALIWIVDHPSFKIKQGYISDNGTNTVRVRMKNDTAFLTVKGPTEGYSRDEFEYQIPMKDALEMLPLCENRLVEKTRYEIMNEGRCWEIDVFEGRHKGLIIAEIELLEEDEEFDIPPWLHHEVSGEPTYYNSHLAKN
jgi:adenylate cyclase